MIGVSPTLHDVLVARRRLRRYLRPTPLILSDWLSALTAARVLLKLESVQPTHAFKIRGALNAALALMARDGAPRAIVTASAGNHGRGLAVAAEQLGLRATVFAPASAPETKKAAIRRHKAELRETADYDEAERQAREHARTTGETFISPYNHPDVIAAAGTIALELLDEAPDVDTVIVPLGGGGLASGIGMALDSAAPQVRVVGVEAAASTPFAVGFARGLMTAIIPAPSLADGLVGNLEEGSMTFDLVRRHVDALVAVSEEALEDAIRGLAREDHLITEAAGAAATAAVLERGVIKPGTRAVVLVTGGNIDIETFARLISRGARSGR